MFYIDEEHELSLSDIKYYIGKFKTTVLPRITRLDRYYQNKNDAIINRYFEDSSKPNNKICHSFANYITTTNTTMFLGSPISYTGTDDMTEYMAVLEDAYEEDCNINLATNCSKYGYAIQLLYLDNNGNIKFSVLDNIQTILVFSETMEKELLYCIQFWTVNSLENICNEYIEIYSRDIIIQYKNDILQEIKKNRFSNIPVVIYKNNNDQTGDYENVISLIDAYDLLESDSLNENDYFNNAYLYLNSDSVDVETLAAMKENRVIYGLDLNPFFVLKNSQNADNDIEKNRIVSDIHKLSFTPDMSDNNFANNVSGVAMRYKLLGTLNNIANKQRKFKKAIQERNKLIFDMLTLMSRITPSYVDIVFTINLPENILETAQTINQLRGLISDETLIAQLPFIQDAGSEVEQANKGNSYKDIYEE